MVAGFRPQKDQDTLIRAMKRLPNNFHLWLIGDGERRKELEILTQKEETHTYSSFEEVLAQLI